MKTLTLIPVGIFAVSFLIALIWSRRSKDRLVARYRLLVIAMLTLGFVVIGMAFTNPNVGLLGFIVVIAIGEWERRRLSRQIYESRK